MAERQHHGIEFQRLILETFPQFASQYTEKWDIPSAITGGLPISIKFLGEKNAVELGSAIRFWETEEDFTLLIGRWRQEGVTKQVISVDEYRVTPALRLILKGNVTFGKMKEFVETLTLANFPVGKHEEARLYAARFKASIQEDLGLITVSAKVDNKDQRRIQCSINNGVFTKLFGKPSGNLSYRGKEFSAIAS